MGQNLEAIENMEGELRGPQLVSLPSGRLLAKCVPVPLLSDRTIRSMFLLFKNTYLGVVDDDFRRDLAAKSHVILVVDSASRLRGFSTLTVWPHTFEGKSIRLLYSGDTVIERSAWGHPALPFAFLSAAGSLRMENASKSYFWLLTSKGHRTYRFLNLFFYRFWPQPDVALEYEEALARNIGTCFFSDRFDQRTGVLRGTSSTGRLREDFAAVPSKDQNRADVRFFIDRNPDYDRGDELLCVAELCSTNMRPFARRIFDMNDVSKSNRLHRPS